MATTYYQGFEGSVKFNSAGGAATAVARVTSWTMSVKKEILDTTYYGNTYVSRVGGLVSGSGNLELVYTGENTALIEAANSVGDMGTAVFELYLSTSANKKISFRGIIDSADYGVTPDDAQRITCSFVTTGPITTEL